MSSPSDHLLLQRYSFHLTASALTTETPETTATTTPSAAVATVTTATMIPIALSVNNGATEKATKVTVQRHIENNQSDILVYKRCLRPCKDCSVPAGVTCSSSPTASSSSSSPLDVSSGATLGEQYTEYVWNRIESDHNVDYDLYYSDDDSDTAVAPAMEEEEVHILDTRALYLATLCVAILSRLNRPPSNVKGDPLHCFKILGDSMKKKNGAHAAFMRGVSDALYMISKFDLESAEQALRAQGMNDHQIEVQKKLFWKKRFLKHCRRTTGHDRVEQLMRFDKFIATFILVKDAKTKELLIGPATLSKIEATRLCIASGYYTDPDSINMFRELGRDRLGRMKYACYRGTNALEVSIRIVFFLLSLLLSSYYTFFSQGYHRHVRDILRRHRCSPELAYHIVRHFNYRWNLRRARDYRGRQDGMHHCYNQAAMEEIQRRRGEPSFLPRAVLCWGCGLIFFSVLSVL